MKYRHSLRMGFLILILLLSIQTVFAQIRPAMNVYINWTPNEQLTSIDINNNGTPEAGDDFRYVDMQIYATGNVAFWAVDLSCTIGSTAILELISLDFPDEWGRLATNDNVDNDDFYYTPQSSSEIYVGSTFAFTVTRIGVMNAPLGVTGQNYTQLIASARFRVLPLTSNTAVTPVCRTMNFLDRDGNISIRGRQTRLGNLSIRVGYTLSGTALREGTAKQNNIRVTCYSFEGADFKTTHTDLRGNFHFGGAISTTDTANWLRDYGMYRCLFTSEYVLGVDDVQILQSVVYFDLQSPQYHLMPIVLRAGDHQDNDFINFADIFTLTTIYGNIVPPFDIGDANGNGIVDDTDLVITAGNINTPTQLFSGADNGTDVTAYLSNHVIYGIGRDLDPRASFPNSKIWLGDALSGGVTPMNARSRTRDFWPQLSPDGTQVAYVSENARSKLLGLSVLNAANGRSQSFRMPRGWTLNALAPSWSPDGSQIAFVCAENTASNAIDVGILYNRGDICIINTLDRTGRAIFQLGVSSQIYPPTWMTYDLNLLTPELEAGYVLLYGGVDNKIHYYDLAHGTQGIVPISAGGSDELYQPNIVHYLFNGNTYLSYIIDPFNDVDPVDGINDFDPHIQVGTIAYDGTDFGGQIVSNVADASTGVTAGLSATHVSLASFTTGVDYYDISPTLDIMFYLEYNDALTVNAQDPFIMYTAMHDNTTPLTWGAAEKHIPDSFIGNPVGVTNGNGIYKPTSDNPTYLHAQRATFDWIP